MHLTDELTKLAEMHERGQLSEQEFLQAKKRLLNEEPSQAPFTDLTLPRTLDAPPPSPRILAAQSSASDEAGNDRVFHSSRWSSGNSFFRDRVTAAGDGITFRKGALFGSAEEHISYRSIASFKVDHGIFLSNITIETAGGSQPIFINGLWKSDAKALQEIIRRYQTSDREKL
jgi:hypothetical protein